MAYLSFVCVLLFGVIEGLDKTKIEQTPSCQQNFNFEKILGRWYVQADVATCSWSGVNEFQDWVVEEIRDKRGVIGRETWRASTGDCTTVDTRITPQSDTSGRFLLKDTFGDVISGDQIVVATDYKSFVIEWGCVKRSFDGLKCDDPYLTISTRLAHPKPYTFKIIETILQKMWGISLRELRRVKHINGIPNDSETENSSKKQTVQPHEMMGDVNIQIWGKEQLYYPSKENKGADQGLVLLNLSRQK